VINGDGMDFTGMFAINATTGVVTMIAAMLSDFESTAGRIFTLTALDSSSTTAPALIYVANADPTTGGSLKVNNLTTLQSKVGSPFTVRFTIKDKNGLAGALSFTLTLTINVTNIWIARE